MCKPIEVGLCAVFRFVFCESERDKTEVVAYCRSLISLPIYSGCWVTNETLLSTVAITLFISDIESMMQETR